MDIVEAGDDCFVKVVNEKYVEENFDKAGQNNMSRSWNAMIGHAQRPLKQC
jgi:hypothetical protein